MARRPAPKRVSHIPKEIASTATTPDRGFPIEKGYPSGDLQG
jgi:hypothetical protein